MKSFSRTLALAALLLPSLGSAATVVNCPADPGGGGDGMSRSFYLPSYGAGTLDTVTVNYHASITGSYTISMEARLNAFDGTLVGTVSSTATVFDAAPGGTPVTFNFGNAVIPAGSTITFTHSLTSGPGSVSQNVGQGPCTGVVGTNGSTPPLDSVRRPTLAVVVTGNAAPAAAVQAVPTLSEWGVILTSALLAFFGVLYTRRRR